MRVEQPHESNCIAIAPGRRSRRHAAATAGALPACHPTEERLGGYGLALSGQTSRTCARTRAMASQHSGAMPVQALNDYEINRKAEDDGEFAGLKSCATYEVRRHVRSPAPRTKSCAAIPRILREPCSSFACNLARCPPVG